MSVRSLAFAASLALIGAAGISGAAVAEDHNTHASSCFFVRDWQGWKSPSPNVIYLRVGVSQVYRLDLSVGSNQLQYGDVHLFSRIWDSSWICSPLDLDLQVADNHGTFREPLIVKSITKLTPDEIAAIPPKFRP
jgi:hypothetical protein